jgi:very-short-patch-repair endonuclease
MRTSKSLQRFARNLRADSTDAEQCLWYHLRSRRMRALKFRRQRPIGPYIVDFVCLESRVIIEVDGGQHQEQTQSDRSRDALLCARGFLVLRFWDNDVLRQTEAVLERIWTVTQTPRPSPPAPLPQSGRGESNRRRMK